MERVELYAFRVRVESDLAHWIHVAEVVQSTIGEVGGGTEPTG